MDENRENIDGGAEKTYSEADFKAELDKRVAAAVESEKAKWQSEYEERLKSEKDEAARLAKMNAGEREKAEFEKRVEEFNEKEAKYQSERLEFECTKQLAAEKLPVEMAAMLTGADADATKANIEAFKSVFGKAVEAEITEQLKGRTPEKSGGAGDTWLESARRGAGLQK